MSTRPKKFSDRNGSVTDLQAEIREDERLFKCDTRELSKVWET